MVCFVRIDGYNEFYVFNLIFVIILMVGMGVDGCYCVIKIDYCFLYCLDNLGNLVELNLIVLWDVCLLESFKEYCMKMSVKYFFI